MAAPVGHMVFALALLNSPEEANIADKKAFLLGVNWPDIRYVAPISRAITHELVENNLSYVLKADTSFEQGRRFHVLVDKLRESYMKNNNVYQYMEKGPWASQMLKLAEDDHLFEGIKYKFDAKEIFNEIHPEELKYGVSKEYINKWHNLLKAYLRNDYYFDFMRYYNSLLLFKYEKNLPKNIYERFFHRIKKLSFGLAAYFKMLTLRRNEKLKAIIFGFYDNPMDFLRSD